MELGLVDRSLQGSGMMAGFRTAASGTNAWNQRFGTVVVKSSWKSYKTVKNKGNTKLAMHDLRISWQCASALRCMGSDGKTKKISLSFVDYISIYFHPQSINLWIQIESVDIRWYVACQQWSSYIFPFSSDKASSLCSRVQGLKDPIFFTQKSTVRSRELQW